MSDLLKGVIDMHIHGSPSVAARRNTPDMMRDMGKMGCKGFVLKDHYYPSAGVCHILNQWLQEETGVTACGSIVLNNAVGGLNLYAVDMAVNMGTKVVSFPTVSAKCHIDVMAAAHPYAGSSKVMAVSEGSNPLTVLDDTGELKKEAVAIIEYLAKRPEVCLYTGHISTEEIDKVAACAFEKGVKKLYANHPNWMIPDTPLEHIRQWADMGMYIELNLGCMKPWSMAKKPAEPESMLEIIRTCPTGQLVLCTDLGTTMKPLPTEGMKAFIDFLTKNDVTEDQISIMAKEVPAYLLGI